MDTDTTVILRDGLLDLMTIGLSCPYLFIILMTGRSPGWFERRMAGPTLARIKAKPNETSQMLG